MKRSDFLKNTLAATAFVASGGLMSLRFNEKEEIIGLCGPVEGTGIKSPNVLVPDLIEEMGSGIRDLVFFDGAKITGWVLVGNLLVDETSKTYFVRSITGEQPQEGYAQLRISVGGIVKQRRKYVTGKQFVVFSSACKEGVTS